MFMNCLGKQGLTELISCDTGCFCPVFRLHGYREPPQPQHGTTGGAGCVSGAPNEIWSYGDRCFAIMAKYLRLREMLRPYIRDLMKQAHERGTPIIRPLFYEFPKDSICWGTEEQYMFGDRYLCAPILESECRRKTVYLPEGSSWRQFDDGQVSNPKEFSGGAYVDVDCPLEIMPVFERV